MFLNYVSLVILLLGLIMVFYVFIFLHDLPYSIAKKRKHPQVEAIHVACWLSLFTLHAIWPIVFIWSIANQAPQTPAEEEAVDGKSPVDLVRDQLERLEQRISQIETSIPKPAKENS